jgi:hypothetical protein
MLRYVVLLLLVTFVAWRYLPRVRVTWLAVATLFVVVVGARTAQQLLS